MALLVQKVLDHMLSGPVFGVVLSLQVNQRGLKGAPLCPASLSLSVSLQVPFAGAPLSGPFPRPSCTASLKELSIFLAPTGLLCFVYGSSLLR